MIRFIPIEEINVELIENDENKNSSWQLIQIDSKTRLKTLYRFANRDAQTFVKTINNCISSISTTTTVEWRQNFYDRTITGLRNSDPSCSIEKSTSQRFLSSRSCHTMLPSNSKSMYEKSDNHRRSPSPIWKRRTTPVRRQPLSMNNRRKTLKDSTDC